MIIDGETVLCQSPRCPLTNVIRLQFVRCWDPGTKFFFLSFEYFTYMMLFSGNICKFSCKAENFCWFMFSAEGIKIFSLNQNLSAMEKEMTQACTVLYCNYYPHCYSFYYYYHWCLVIVNKYVPFFEIFMREVAEVTDIGSEAGLRNWHGVILREQGHGWTRDRKRGWIMQKWQSNVTSSRALVTLLSKNRGPLSLQVNLSLNSFVCKLAAVLLCF